MPLDFRDGVGETVCRATPCHIPWERFISENARLSDREPAMPVTRVRHAIDASLLKHLIWVLAVKVCLLYGLWYFLVAPFRVAVDADVMRLRMIATHSSTIVEKTPYDRSERR
jgi:hypothetical protein